MKNYQVAIIGYGITSKAHIAALQSIRGISVIAIVSRHMTQFEYDQTEPFGSIRFFSTFDELLAADRNNEIRVDIIQDVTLTFTDGRIAHITSDISHQGSYYFPIYLSGENGSLINDKLYLASGENEQLSMKLLGSGDPKDHPY